MSTNIRAETFFNSINSLNGLLFADNKKLFFRFDNSFKKSKLFVGSSMLVNLFKKPKMLYLFKT